MSVSELSEQLVKAGNHVDVFTTTANGPHELNVITRQPVLINGVSVTYFKRITKDHSHLSPALLKALWKNVKQYDVVHIHAWWNLVSVLACFVAVAKKVPVLVSPRGTLSNYSHHNKSRAAKRAMQFFFGNYLLNNSHIHTTSAAEHDAIMKLFKPKGISVIPNFVKLPSGGIFEERKATGVFKLIFLSRIEPKKGLDILIKALPGLRVPYTLTIAGTGGADYMDEVKEIARENRSDAHINWIGFQSENKFALLHAHDLMVLPSYDENFGNVVIESLAAGTPVLISEQVGLADYVSTNHLGWICRTNPVSVSALVNEIAISRRDELRDIRSKAPKIIADDFNEANLVAKYLDNYAGILKDRTG
jgi:glycosyltransferase involved in cell wall biosynthesis